MTETRLTRLGLQDARYSLRWRLRAVSGVLIILVLVSFLWAAYRQVEETLVASGASRATAAAQEIAERLARSMETVMTTTARMQKEPALVTLLRNPDDKTRAAARAALVPATAPTAPPALRRNEVWDTTGSLVLEIESARADTSRLQSYPRGTAPRRAGISELKPAGKFTYFEITVDVRPDTTAGAPRLGYLRRFGQLTSPGMSIKRLLGSEAVLKIGAPDASTWTDFFTIVDAMPARDGRDAQQFVAADGARWIGGTAAIEGTPWLLWVGYPRAVVLAPARAFLREMLVIGFLFVAFSVALAALLGVRLTRPLHALATAADEIAAGNYRKRVTADRRDEIGLLGRAFNLMSDRVEDAYASLRASHEQTHFLLATARIGVWEARLDVDSVTCSGSMSLVHGGTQRDMPRTRGEFLEMVHPEDRDALRSILTGTGLEDGVVSLQYRAVTQAGRTYFVEGKARLKLDDDKKPVSVLGVSMDVTDRRRLESQLRQAQKMEAIGQLAGGVAHDFNNMLTAIVGHAQLVLDAVAEAGSVREDVNEILKAAESAAGLTRQLLAFSRQQVMQTNVIAVNAVVEDTNKLLRRLIGENIQVVTQLAPELRMVRADSGQLQQVVMNLVVNARDAMPDGGTVTIRTFNADVSGSDPDKHGTVPPGSYVVLSVTDSGTGMDEETQRRLFEPFFTTKQPGKGTGLGLATVFGIVMQSDGHIHVESAPNRGSTFAVYLPATSDKMAASSRGVAPARRAGGGETILIVEDSEPVRAIARTILQRHGYKVLVASSGDEALRMIDAIEGPLDLIISDVVMPGMTGPELARRLTPRHGHLRVLFTSGYSGDAIVRHGLESDSMFIEKPYTPTALRNKVHEALRRDPV